ncbi:MAG: hypothetical protein VXW28_07515, partial [Candidatus Thermoplasmatota archaeon]|nr:hypothetical protein [Candidatus Thermoplasmatota archaeon]
STATALALGSTHSCAILDDGSTYCWGYNAFGQLGDSTNTNSNTPVIATEMDTSLEITNSVDTVYSTPMSEFVAVENDVFATRQVDDKLYKLRPENLQAYIYEDVTSPSNLVNYQNSIQLIGETEQYGKEIYRCYTHNDMCSILFDTNTEIEKYGEPTPGDIGSTASSNLAMGRYHSCAIFDDGSIQCWGFNNQGQLGDGTTTDSTTPVAVSLPAGSTATALALGSFHSCAILDDGSAMCWGYNGDGELGDGTTTNSNTPVAVNLPAGRTATALALGWQHSCAILDDGSTYCWGYN